MKVSFALAVLLVQVASVDAFSSNRLFPQRSNILRLQHGTLPAVSSSVQATSSANSPLTAKKLQKKEKLAELRKEGGRLTIMTPYGALNPYGLYYGVLSVLLGIPWFIAMTALQFFYFVTRGKIDKQRKMPILISQLWGETLMTLTRNWPKMKRIDILQNFYKEKRPAMIVANHNSWMDIPFLGGVIGWRNYKLVSKKELGQVPILGKSIKVGGHIMVDRSDRKSGLKTLKKGIQYLKDGVHLGTFPEGTRSRSGKLGKFKNGAFKMAYKAEAPIIPISINGAAKVMSSDWIMPHRPAAGVAEVIIHEPIESKGKTEEQLAEEVRKSMISGLVPEQRPDE